MLCAGCYAVVLESVPQKIAELVTSKLSIPTIGIGAGIDLISVCMNNMGC